MFLQILWFVLVAVSLLWGVLTNQASNTLPALLEGTGRAVSLSLQLAAGYLFFCGIMNIVNNLKIRDFVERSLSPILRRVMGPIRDPETAKAVSMNLTANLLGLGNAATPYGIEAAGRLYQQGNTHALYMLLILNATSIQLLPTTVLTLRIAAASAMPNAILLPTLAATTASTLTGAGLGMLCRKILEAHHSA